MGDSIGAGKGFAPDHKWDRNFFLILALLAWVGILAGFGSDTVRHFATHATAYPLIVHFHAVAFVGWLVLFTTQIILIRFKKFEIHRKLGLAMAGLAIVMVILGPATALISDGMKFGMPESDPSFLSIQFTDILAFAGLVTAALIFRKSPSAHKRLILLATLYITDAGFGRWLGGPLAHAFGFGFWGALIVLYLASNLLILSLGLYDLITRRRLHTAYIAGVAWVFANELLATWLYHSPVWRRVATHLIGH